jgi:hypothetical protein
MFVMLRQVTPSVRGRLLGFVSVILVSVIDDKICVSVLTAYSETLNSSTLSHGLSISDHETSSWFHKMFWKVELSVEEPKLQLR